MSRLLIRVLIAPRGNRPKLKFRTRLLLLHGARQDEARVSRANGRVLMVVLRHCAVHSPVKKADVGLSLAV